jgi:hypothetical protein
VLSSFERSLRIMSTRIKVATETYYLHEGKAYKRGDNVPSGASLLVRKGSPILPEVADRYGVSTEETDNVTRVPDAGRTPDRIRGVGVSSLADEGFKRIDAHRDVTQETAGLNATIPHAGAGVGRQAAMMRSDMIEERIKDTGGVDASTTIIEPGTAEAQEAAAQGGGIGGAPINDEITRKLEQGEIEATARHTGAAMRAAQREPETADERGATSGATDGGGIKASTMSPEGGASSSATSVTREITPGGDDTAAKIKAEEEAKRKAEEEAAAREQETRTPPATS